MINLFFTYSEQNELKEEIDKDKKNKDNNINKLNKKEIIILIIIREKLK